MDCDVIISGGGPSGLMAAKECAEHGLKVILIDLKKEIPLYIRPCCSMWMTEPGYHNENYSFENDSIFFEKNRFSVNYSGNFTDLSRSVRISAKGHTVIMGKKDYPAARVIDKEALLRGLYEEALKAGVKVRNQTLSTMAEEDSQGVKVKVTYKGKASWITGKILLAADGVNSKITESLGLNKKRKIIFDTHVVAYHMTKVKTPYPDAWTRFTGNAFTGAGGVNMLPKPHKPDEEPYFEVYAPTVDYNKVNEKEIMNKFFEYPVVKEWFQGAEVTGRSACRWIVWSPVKNPAKGKIIILGDSAAFQEVENQGGLMCGYRGAKAAIEELEGRKGFDDYNKFWQNFFEFNDKKMVERSCRGAWVRNLRDDDIDYLYSLLEGEFIDGYINHFESGSKLLEILEKKIDRIKKERPKIAVIMESFYRLSPEDFFA